MPRDIAAEKQLAMQVRREFNRAGLDISRMEVVSVGGNITLYGWIKRARGDVSNESVEARVNRLIERIKRMPGVRDVINYARIRED
ncbi:MAG: BON domain-containing protein [Armatimonadetes bacterium]|nr:BON domain-containing protein [Armatimonadota bacterium]MDW8027786.1 BON domain-containing protein [Armatimonadota bacterium]